MLQTIETDRADNSALISQYPREARGSNLGLLSGYSTDDRLTRNQLALVPTSEAKGRFHRPVGFFEYAEETAHQLDRLGLAVTAEEHLVGHDNQRYFGLLEIGAKEGELITSPEWRLLLGLRGSHDQSIQRGIALGRSVMVCSNLCFSGDIYTSSTKQTTNVWDRLPAMLHEACAKVPELAHREERRVEHMQGFELRPRHGDAALVEIHRRKGLNAAQLGRAIAQWDTPTYPEHAENGHTAWRLEQAVTEAVKPTGQTSNLFTVQDRTQVASDFLSEVIGL